MARGEQVDVLLVVLGARPGDGVVGGVGTGGDVGAGENRRGVVANQFGKNDFCGRVDVFGGVFGAESDLAVNEKEQVERKEKEEG